MAEGNIEAKLEGVTALPFSSESAHTLSATQELRLARKAVDWTSYAQFQAYG